MTEETLKELEEQAKIESALQSASWEAEPEDVWLYFSTAASTLLDQLSIMGVKIPKHLYERAESYAKVTLYSAALDHKNDRISSQVAKMRELIGKEHKEKI